MHRGNPYPYMADRWVNPTAFWPGFMPAFVVLEHSALPADWVLTAAFKEVSFEGVASVDRQEVRYLFDSIDGMPSDFGLELVAYNDAGVGGRNAAYRLRLWYVPAADVFDNRAFAISGLEFTGPSPFPYGWTDSVDVPTGLPIPNPGSVPRPAVWSEIP